MVIILIIELTNDYDLMEPFFMKKKTWLDLEKKGRNKRKTRLWPESPLKVDLLNTIDRRSLSAASFQTKICREHLSI